MSKKKLGKELYNVLNSYALKLDSFFKEKENKQQHFELYVFYLDLINDLKNLRSE